jgi:dihydroxy-acid dehydratase
MGISSMQINSMPALSELRAKELATVGSTIMHLLENDITARQIITRQAIENAIASVIVTGGSTNAVLHLLAIAREGRVNITIDDFDRISRCCPILADLKPTGQFLSQDLHNAGGIRLVAARLKDAGQLHDLPTVTGKTTFVEASMADETSGQQVMRQGGLRDEITKRQN